MAISKKAHISPYIQNFYSALPKNDGLLDIRDFVESKRYVPGISVKLERKKVYEDKDHKEWMVNYRQPKIQNYIGSGLYKLILGDASPNEQLIKVYNKLDFSHYGSIKMVATEGNIGIASEFISGFVTLTSRADYIPLDVFRYDNSGIVFATMILLGESDLHSENLGKIKNKNGQTILAKIDHDNSAICFDTVEGDNIPKFARCFSQVAGKLEKQYFNWNKVINFINIINNLIPALKEINDVPDELWDLVVEQRAKAFRSIVPLGQNYNLNRFKILKNEIPNFIKSLEWESAIISNNTKEVKKLIDSGYDLNKKYYHISWPDSSTDGYKDIFLDEVLYNTIITPVEMAAKTPNLTILKYLYKLTSINFDLQRKLLKICLYVEHMTSTEFIKAQGGETLKDFEHLFLAIMNKDFSIIQKEFLDQNKLINFDLVSDVHRKIVRKDNVLIYQKFAETKHFSLDDYLKDCQLWTQIGKWIVSNVSVYTQDEAIKKFNFLRDKGYKPNSSEYIKAGIFTIFQHFDCLDIRTKIHELSIDNPSMVLLNTQCLSKGEYVRELISNLKNCKLLYNYEKREICEEDLDQIVKASEQIINIFDAKNLVKEPLAIRPKNIGKVLSWFMKTDNYKNIKLQGVKDSHFDIFFERGVGNAKSPEDFIKQCSIAYELNKVYPLWSKCDNSADFHLSFKNDTTIVVESIERFKYTCVAAEFSITQDMQLESVICLDESIFQY